MKTIPIRALWLAAWMFAPMAFAQNFAIDAFAISGGGGASAGGAYTMNGTIGQTAPGVSTGGSYSVDGGFWSIIEVLQTPGSPALGLTHSGANLIISWDNQATGFILEQTTSLAAPIQWSTAAGVTGNSATVTPSPGYKFYRLRHP